ncbi:arylsulfatase, partial [Klebsiella oxytoca]
DMQMAIYAAVIEEVDRSIGRVVEHLKEKGVLDNTLIILLSDNGGNGEPGIEGRFAGKNPGSAGSTVFLGAAWADVANAPFFLYKHHGHEGGCNTPFI